MRGFMANEKCIRDPIYNYIYLTDVEAQLIKNPLFQRLRFISQNGAAYFTYPSNRNCRFLHSLGCMKLGGDIFLSAVQDIHNSDVRDYLLEAFDMIKGICRDSLNQSIFSVIKSCYVRKDKTLIKYGLNLCIDVQELEYESDIITDHVKIEFSKTVLFQSVRLACLLHDIGHFPFSHALERAFGQYIDYMDSVYSKDSLDSKDSDINENKREFYMKFKGYVENGINKIHENIGLKIIEYIMPVSSEDSFHRLCRFIARFILAQTRDEYRRILEPLHGIVSGTLDADRLDYSLRDPRVSALEFGAFDIERLIENFTIYKNDKNYLIVAKVQALSSIENFYYQRFMLYKYLIYHHSKLRMDEIVKEITYELLNLYFEGKSKIHDLLETFHFDYLWKYGNSIEYYYCNENWFLAMIQCIYIKLETERIKAREYDKLKMLISTFIFRRVENIYSFFKRYNQYLNFINLIQEEIEKKTSISYDRTELAGVILELMKRKEFEDKKKEIYNKYKVICLIAKTQPKVLDIDSKEYKDFIVLGEKDNGNKGLMEVSELSPSLSGLKCSAKKEQLFNIFLIGKNIKANMEKIDEIKKEIISVIVQYYIDVTSVPSQNNSTGIDDRPPHDDNAEKQDKKPRLKSSNKTEPPQ